MVESPLAGGSYPVVVEAGALERLSDLLESHAPAEAYAVVADARVAETHGGAAAETHGGGAAETHGEAGRSYGERVRAAAERAGARATLLTFPPGERSKSREEWARLTDLLLEWGMGRRGVIIALGGGVAGDLAGFVAATYLRGVRVVQVPTSLVAMIDASVGGKTAIDLPAGKNLVGAFHPPRLVVADPAVVETLPRGERSQGLAEAVKHGAILDASYLGRLEEEADRLLDGDPEALLPMVRRSVELKAGVVAEDEREAGIRKILNFGHTLAHGLEASSSYRLPHGSAVAIGMVLEARIGERAGITRAGTSERLARIVERMELPSRPGKDVDPEEVLRFTGRDKKGSGRFVLLEEVGRVAPGDEWTHPVTPDAVREVLEGP